MKYSKIKIIVCIGWILGVFALIITQKSTAVIAYDYELKSAIPKPKIKEVEKFNSLILNRFLTQPSFGFGRMVPIPTPSLHLSGNYTQSRIEQFSPKEGDEKNRAEDFEKKGWKVGLYLFGKHANKTFIISNAESETNINYRLFKPIAITKNIKDDELAKPEKLLEKVKAAFIEFQLNEKDEKKVFEFNTDGWWYFAKPVRAVNQSCVDCHIDNRVPMPLRTGKFEFRTRKIGDVNGVLVYGFKKTDKK